MRAGLTCLTLALLASLSLGCDESDHPLSSFKHPTADPELEGVWTRTEATEYTQYAHFATELNHAMHLTIVNHPLPHSTSGADVTQCDVTATHVGDQHLLTYLYKDDQEGPHYWFLRYDVQGETLNVSQTSYPKLKAAVDSHELHGKAWQTTLGTNVQLTDPGSVLSNWFQGHSDAWEAPQLWHRVRVDSI